jgi:hypothetical protein
MEGEGMVLESGKTWHVDCDAFEAINSRIEKHLADHVAISAEALEKTELCGKMPAGPCNFDLVNLCDKKNLCLQWLNM